MGEGKKKGEQEDDNIFVQKHASPTIRTKQHCNNGRLHTQQMIITHYKKRY